jgi:hypothetical protein
MFIEISDSHPEKALLPIVVSVLGKLTLVNLSHFEKVSAYSEVIPSLTVTDVISVPQGAD